MTSHCPTSRKVFIGLALAILLDTGLQFFWKMAVAEMADQPTLWLTVKDMLRQPVFLLVGALMAGQALNWVVVLDHADLSYAHAITSLSYVSVAALSVLYLGETITLPQMVGIALILAGVWFVGKSGPTGAPVAGEAS
jgi:drug/metabolite transporter (DMT)-like permease